MYNHANFPWWLKPANRIIITLYRLGWVFGLMDYQSDLITTPYGTWDSFSLI